MARFQRRYRRPVKPAAKSLDVPKLIRENSRDSLADMGYQVSPGLPLTKYEEIQLNYTFVAQRLLALKVVFTYVVATPEQVPTEVLQTCIRENRLASFFSEADRAMLKTPRAVSHQQHRDAVGWRLENMVALAAIFNSAIMQEIGPTMCAGENVEKLLNEDCPPYQGSANAWAHAHDKMDAALVVMLEDFFYCWHNAARSIVFSGLENPTDLDPRVLCGIIEERRHSLTWAVAGGEWDATDLST